MDGILINNALIGVYRGNEWMGEWIYERNFEKIVYGWMDRLMDK